MYKSLRKQKITSCFRGSHVWSKEKVAVSPFKTIDIPNMNVSEYMWRNLDKWANKTAVVCGSTDRQYTYLQLYQKSQTFGASLRKKFNIKDGDTIAVMLPNIPEYPVVAFGILAAGAVITTFNHLYTPYEIQKLLLLSNAKIIITLPEHVIIVKQAMGFAKKHIPVIAVDIEQNRLSNTASLKELIENNVDLSIIKEVKRSSTDVVSLLYSSGTTGLPKGVELTHRNIISNSEQQSTECKRHEDTSATYQDTALAILPFSHSSGFGINLFHKLSAGIRLVTVRKFHPDILTDILEKYNIDICTLTPPTALFLGSYPRVTSKHLENLRYIGIGAAPIPKVDIERLLDKANKNIHIGQIYGLTETSPVATLGPIGFKKITSAGFALPNVSLRVVDSEMNNLGPNEKGELLIMGPNVMKGYKNNPEANKNAFYENEWLKTGDLVSIDEDGAVYIADRIRDLIKVNAYQVPPAELESIIKEIPKVVDVAVVGIKDSRTGQRPKAFIILNDKNIGEKEIMNYVNQRVAPYKHLKEISFVDNIPKNASGKILKRILIEEYSK